MVGAHQDLLRYSLSEAARFLRVNPSTLRWWLEGGKRGGKIYPPVLREESTGSSDLTWYEFIEAGWLSEYRRHVPLRRLRPLVSALRNEFQVLNPLATIQPFVGAGLTLVRKLQSQLDIPEVLWIVVGSGQLMLSKESDSFVKRVEFHRPTGAAGLYIVMPATEPVVLNPLKSFGIPTIRGIRAETLSELALAGDPYDMIIDIYSDYGITQFDIDTAIQFEREYMGAAA